jgi:hypothetical protein
MLWAPSQRCMNEVAYHRTSLSVGGISGTGRLSLPPASLPSYLLGGVWPLMLLLALAAPINHDEDQYLAAALLAKTLRPFSDFLYLQTPLQPFVSAPLVGIAGNWNLIVLRLATATLAALLLWLVRAAALAAGAPPHRALLAAALMACCKTFLFTAGVFRNDMLPAVLAAAAILAGIKALQARPDDRCCWGLAGLCFGAAASAKVSYAVPAAAAAAFLLARYRMRRRRSTLEALLAFAVGGAAGVAPCLFVWLQAPEAFRYGVFTFPAQAPSYWYALNGYGARLTLSAKLRDSLEIMVVGPALAATLCVAIDSWRRRKSLASRGLLRFLDILILAGLLAAMLPTPTWKQYFLPLLPPLFVRFALIEWRQRRMSPLLAVFLATSAVGAASSLSSLGDALFTGQWPALQASDEAHWVGRELARAAAAGPIATLSPHVVIDSGITLDPTFATGAFGFRSAATLDAAGQQRLHIVGPASLAAHLERVRPAAIITGYESFAHIDRVGLDGGLRHYALAHHFIEHRSPYGEADLFIRPAKQP